MNQVLGWLSGGDLRSDGLATEVAEIVLKNPEIFEDLIQGLNNADDLIRGRTADALEKIARKRPDLLKPYLTDLLEAAQNDTVMMVQMHLAMILGYMALYAAYLDELILTLFMLLNSEYVFVRSWAISSLCIIARMYPERNRSITERIVPLQNSDSPAIRSRVRNALNILTDQNCPFPKGWIKSTHLSGVL